MKRIYKNKKGASLITVMIILTVLTLLSVVLVDMSIQGLVLSKRSKNIDFAYYAGESSIENWFSEIKKLLSDPTVGNDYPSGFVDITLTGGVGQAKSIENYANWLIFQEFNLNSLSTQYIDISNVASPVTSLSGDNFAEVELEGVKIGDVRVKTASNDTIIVSIELVAVSNYFPASSPYQAGNKQIFAKRDFEVKIPLPSEGFLTGAIFSVRDFYVSGEDKSNSVVNVKGDVNVFGSFTPNYKNPSQHYYGGIYALKKANLNIDGNAYSRSFIRTGRYAAKYGSYFTDTSYSDSSEIRIKKDAVAQSLQIFGSDDRVVVYRNAYTFDDLEMNGLESVLAVNGSFFGLSRGGSHDSHDESSAIVNSAIIHHAYTTDLMNRAKKSRIVVNGDVILGGGTFKVVTEDEATVDNPVGSRVGQIEDASIAWHKDEYPYYKEFNATGSWSDEGNYHNALRREYRINNSNISGFMNLFQKWSIKGNELEIDDWLSQIDRERNNIAPITFDDSNPTKIRGYWNYEIAANGKIYQKFRPGYAENPSSSDSEYRQDLFVNNSEYRIENIFDTNNKLTFGGAYWNSINGAPAGDYEKIFMNPGANLDNMLQELKAYVEQLASREYGTSEWDAKDNGKFNEMLKKFDNTWSSAAASNPYYLLIDKTELTSLTPSIDSIDINDAFRDYHCNTTGMPDPIDVYSECAVTPRDKKYYLLVNKNPELELKISGPYNGIIFTAGRVVLENGANIYGSIISAGGGYYDGVNFKCFDPTSSDVNSLKVNSESDVENKLDDGDLAGIIFKAGADNEEVYIDFYLGAPTEQDVIDAAKVINSGLVPTGEPEDYYLNRAARLNLLQKFKDNSIDLYNIF